MPHADSSFVPVDVTTKSQFYAHVHEQISSLLDGSRYWVSNLAQASSLLYHSYLSSPLYGFHPDSSNTPLVNWVGFYIHPPCSSKNDDGAVRPLLLGPYNGRPACITITPIAGKGVCADAFVGGKGVVVENVEEYPGHIACDGDTKSEIVLPLQITIEENPEVVGVLDLDATALRTFDHEDLWGLQEVVRILDGASDWS